MKVIKDLPAWRKLRASLPGNIGFVPTMGALHQGHASLLERSVAEQDITVLSIYVNPTQFNDPADLANYPDTLAEDLELAETIGVDYVIQPTYDDMYADGFRFSVQEDQFSLALCGANRPGHFTGVLTVVMKLLNLVRPQRAYFGKKDFQQYRLIRDMCATFFLDVDIVGCETVREADGLAMSSRNKLLSPAARQLAAGFNKALALPDTDAAVAQKLGCMGFQVDYVESHEGQRFGAVVVDSEGRSVRLIDNLTLAPEPAEQISNPATSQAT